MKRNWMLAGAVAAMMAAAVPATHAQDATPAPAPMTTAPAPMTTAPAPDATPAPAPAPMTTAPAPPMMDNSTANPGSLSTGTTGTNNSMSTGTMGTGSMGTMTPPGAIDFSVLSNQAYDYTDIKKAKAEGLSDNEVASVAKIARLTGYSFTSLVDKVLHGTTFATIAEQSNLKLSDVLDVQDEKDRIAAYETAFEATGSMALKNNMSSMPMSGSMSNMPSSSNMSTTPAMSTTPMAPMAPTMDIVATAMSDKRFSTLVRELKRADLVTALQGAGPFTVFAPTNDAFKKLPKGALKNLEKDPAKLAAVLKYHVIPASINAATATSMTSPTSPPTLEGSTLQVTASGGTVKINDATVTQADIMTTNGIIHAIDTVLMPSDLDATSTTMPMAAPATSTTMPMAAPATNGAMPMAAPATDSNTGTGTAAPTAAGTDTNPTPAAGAMAPAPDTTAPSPATGTTNTGATGATPTPAQ